MNDEAFIQALEDGSLPSEAFTHAAHLRAAWCYLHRHAFLEACIAMRDALKAFAGRIGKAGLYHETITIAFMSLVAERMAAHPTADWQALLQVCPELSERGLLAGYYGPGRLDADLARRQLLLPLPQPATQETAA